MMDDHEEVCAARNALCDALKVLLNPRIMGTSDFTLARHETQKAMHALDRLLEMTILRP